MENRNQMKDETMSPGKKMKKEDKTPIKSTAKKGTGAYQYSDDKRPTKRVKVDHSEEVS